MENIPLETPKIPENFDREHHLYSHTVEKPAQAFTKNNLTIKNSTDVKMSVAYCIDLIYNKQYPFVKLTSSTSNADKAVFIAETLKRKVKNLHQVNTLESYVLTYKYKPNTPSEERFEFTTTENVTNMVIKLMRVHPTDTKVYGYQAPLQINLVSTKDPREYIKYILDMKREPKKKQLMGQGREQQEISLEDYNVGGRKHDYDRNEKYNDRKYNDDNRREDQGEYRAKGGYKGQGSYYNRNYDGKRDYRDNNDYKNNKYKFKNDKEGYDNTYYNNDRNKNQEYNKDAKPVKDYHYDRRDNYNSKPYDNYNSRQTDSTYKHKSDDYDKPAVDNRNYYKGRPYNNYCTDYKNYDRDDTYPQHGNRYNKTPYFEKKYNTRDTYTKQYDSSRPTDGKYVNKDKGDDHRYGDEDYHGKDYYGKGYDKSYDDRYDNRRGGNGYDDSYRDKGGYQKKYDKDYDSYENKNLGYQKGNSKRGYRAD